MKILLYVFTGFTFLLSLFFLFITIKSNNQKFATNTLFSLLLCVLSTLVAVFIPGFINNHASTAKLETNEIKEPHFELITNYDSIDNYKVYCVRTNQTDPQLLGKYGRFKYFSYSSKVLVYYFDEETTNVYIDDNNNHNPWLSFIDEETKKHLVGTYELEKEDEEYWYDKDDATKNQKRRKKLMLDGEYEEPNEEDENVENSENNEESTEQ
ncbi:hypothetical protein [Fusobacterium sp. PH5-44]|uniref:hypothetical protein n=1 Tax=unclassified Fusobacterium TaxID=2648384 RepID=UPI003D1F2820